MKLLKPMLAADAPESSLDIQFPLLASYKIDGIRATCQDGAFISRSLKKLPNLHLQSHFFDALHPLDGELVVGPPNAPDVMRRTTSHIMSRDKVFDFTYYVFDCLPGDGGTSAETRQSIIKPIVEDLAKSTPWIRLVEQRLINDIDELEAYENEALVNGYEGLILRKPTGIYKHGRSTTKQQLLLKLKRFIDSECRIDTVVQQMHNANEATTNELGRTARSSSKDGLVPVEAMGSLEVTDVHSNVSFSIGTGFTAKDREWFWENRHTIKDLIVKYKSFPIGVKDKPRMPVYLGLRDPMDMSL